jgi:hypothetical protein
VFVTSNDTSCQHKKWRWKGCATYSLNTYLSLPNQLSPSSLCLKFLIFGRLVQNRFGWQFCKGLMSLLPHSSLRGFDRCIDNQVAAPVFIFTIWIPYKRFGVDGQIITNRPVFVHFLMLTLSPSLSLSYLHIELIQFNFEAAVPHTWADVLLDRSGTWIFHDFSDSSPVTPAAHEAFVASRESFGHVWTLSSAQTAPTKWRPIVKQNIGKHWDKMYDWKQSKLIYSIYKCI